MLAALIMTFVIIGCGHNSEPGVMLVDCDAQVFDDTLARLVRSAKALRWWRGCGN